MATIWKVDLPGALPKGIESALQTGTVGAAVVTVPEAWCYYVRRPAPPGGWSRRMREELRPGLFPEALDALWWDEEIHLDGTWEVWAISPSRVLNVFPRLACAKGLRARVCTKGQWGSKPALSAFPNVALLEIRAMRWPWAQIRISALWGLPPVAAVLILGGLWIQQHRESVRVGQDILSIRARVDRIQGDLLRERTLFRTLDPSLSLGSAPFVSDMDALTRLIPEDSYGVELRWHRDRIDLNLNTPKPEVVREALEASPEFQNVHFEGNLERRGDRSRLTLSMRPEVPR